MLIAKFMTDILIISKILGVGGLAFIIALLMTPIIYRLLIKYRLGKQIREDINAPIYTQMHGKKAGTPTMGGIIIWGAVLALILVIYIFSLVFEGFWGNLNFLSRGQTLLPLGVLIISAIIGMADDLLGIFKLGPKGGGLHMRHRLILYTAVAIMGALWFYFKLNWDVLHIPFVGDFNIGLWYIPFFIFIIVATAFSTNETDGLDGLAGGVLLFAFAAFAIISFTEGKFDLAVFNAAIVGALLAFLWFNVHPAKFFMGDTGAMSLGVTLGVMAMLTNTAFFLPFLGFILVVESLSVIIQLSSKKILKKKIFKSTPIHHHFEAISWPESQIVMRFWIISGVMAALGMILFFIDRSF